MLKSTTTFLMRNPHLLMQFILPWSKKKTCMDSLYSMLLSLFLSSGHAYLSQRNSPSNPGLHISLWRRLHNPSSLKKSRPVILHKRLQHTLWKTTLHKVDPIFFSVSFWLLEKSIISQERASFLRQNWMSWHLQPNFPKPADQVFLLFSHL